MILKQLKQLTLSATRRNAHLLRLPRLYTSPAAVSQTLTKPCKRLSRDDRRLVVESFVSKYRAANAGKFPTAQATVREVGGSQYIVRNILQELKLRPNAPISLLPNDDASSLKQEDHSIESSHSSSDEVSLQGDNSVVTSATHDGSGTVTASVDSECDGGTHLPDTEQPISQLPASIANDASPLQKDHTIESSHDEVSLQGDSSLVIPATADRSGTVTASLDKDVDSISDGSSNHLPEVQTLKVSEECFKKSETVEEGTLTQIASQEPRADHLQGANVLTTATHDKGETETDPPSTDVDSKCHGSTHLPEIQTLKVADERLKSSETKDEGTLAQLVSPEPKADHPEGANDLPATHGNIETETAPPNDDADSKRDATTQNSKVSEECIKKSETEEDAMLTHLASQEPKADCHEGGAALANVLPTETRQVPEKGDDGEVKTEENPSAWSNIVSFAKGFANFWRKG